jgi:hypothetical protein
MNEDSYIFKKHAVFREFLLLGWHSKFLFFLNPRVFFGLQNLFIANLRYFLNMAARKSAGTSIRKTESGQLEWTMRDPERKPKWLFSKSGKRINSALKIAGLILREFKEHPWIKAHPGIIKACADFLNDPDPMHTARNEKNARVIFDAIRQIKKKPRDARGQRLFGFESQF